MDETRTRTGPVEPKSFARLMQEEDAQLEAGRGAVAKPNTRYDPVIAQPGSAEEPWLAFTNRDRVGLALSGGGIRSATFNLGLLQALRQRGLLELIDYLSTVSGGGYIGGFWTAWRQRSTELDPKDGQPLLFPKQTQNDKADGRNDPLEASPKEIRERPEIRHLREFSRFLMPRVGFADAETWNGIVAIVFGLLPSMAVTLAVLGVILSAWLLFNALVLNCGSPWASAGVMFALHAAINIFSERRFWQRGGAEPAERRSKAWLFVPLTLSLLLGATMGWVCYVWDFVPGLPATEPITTKDWVFSAGPINPPWGVSAPVFAWLLGALVLLFVRLFCNGQQDIQTWRGAYTALALDRGIARCLVPAVIWSTLGALWLFAMWLRTHPNASWWRSVGSSGGIAAVVAALFAWLRDWLTKPVQQTNLQTVVARLKPVLPQLLAYAAVAALFVLVSQAMLFVAFDAHHSEWYRIAGFCLGCLFIIGFALWKFDLSNVGLHEFYRSRISRCFLGAANPEALRKTADYNRQTDERQKDDLLLHGPAGEPPADAAKFQSIRLRPIHLVCCAANHLAGDPLGSLYRGARSAVLSQRGITLGNETASLPTLRLSSALTASAAAFNSNMGSTSMHLGLPVAFLMTALNLRLGLWVAGPRNRNRHRRRLPGAFFFREMFGLTWSDSPRPHLDEADPLDRYKPAPPQPGDDSSYLHLSDGAHFENLALYELVRRHCRYIIVSDCGADPQYSFDDLANTIRRVREDFGVEIELDFDPLKPGPEGFARQHVVAGVIHYDGVVGCDKGTLLYFKPTLTGNEPCDVLQYRTRNPVFPQETTADQFYDEAQWESYHRLGEHSGYESFRFVDDLRAEQAKSAESVFHFARVQWLPGWRAQNEQFLTLTSRCAALEADVRDHAPAFLRAEFFPEVAESRAPAAARAAPGSPAPPAPPAIDEETRAVYFLMLVVQVMEDAWLACRLDTEWAHPLNTGWMGYLHRWASTPSFRRWWPILKPMYNPGFREFVKRRFDLEFQSVAGQVEPAADGSFNPRLQLRRVPPHGSLDGFAWRHRARSATPPTRAPGQDAFVCELLLPAALGSPPLPPLQVGVVLVQIDSKTRCASWTTNDFYVPPALEGAGFVGRFLDALIKELCGTGVVSELRVLVLDAAPPGARPSPRLDPASRARRMQLVDFYRSRHFNYDRLAAGQPTELNQLRYRAEGKSIPGVTSRG